MRALKVLLETFGIQIDPTEVERAWAQAKDALPQLARAVDEMNQRQTRVESKIDEILARQKLMESRIEYIEGGLGRSDYNQLAGEVNHA